MRRITIAYWVFTGLMAAFMLMASIPDVLRVSDAIEVFTRLGYPIYLLPFIGLAKISAVVVVLVPAFRRLKEWAYAGLVFDLIGALYSHLSIGDPPAQWMFAVIGLMLVSGSYLVYQKTRAEGSHQTGTRSGVTVLDV